MKLFLLSVTLIALDNLSDPICLMLGLILIKEFNLKQGKDLGEILNYLLEQVLDEPLYNKKADLLKLAGEYLQKKSN